MRAVDIIIKKREGEELSRAEIDFFVQGFTKGEIPDYQVSAWAMAVLLNGMTPRETTDLTLSMAHSGQVLDLSGIVDVAVDKHSTGGVGDKTTLAVLPIVAACGLPCGKMSGRGLGFSGGTLDKLESIPGYRVDLSTDEFKNQLKDIGIVLTGQSLDLAPADGKLYALRDVTGTVPSMPLIASSIMSKKIAAGATAIVLDVKTGLGAFMENLADARQLADLMTSIGELAGRKVKTLLSDMNQPLGFAVGNVLEVQEALAVLHGGGPHDFREHCLEASTHMLVLAGRSPDLAAARKSAEAVVADGSAFEVFRKLVAAQGGAVSHVDQPEKMAKACFVETILSPASGYLSEIHARLIGEAAVELGAGRAKKSDPVDHAVGFIILHKVGEQVQAGEPLFIVHANDAAKLAAARQAVLAAHKFSAKPVQPLPLFYNSN
jgi:pyrimidine-nucleoside phosphorylase